jgi:hypothetical protein
MLLGTKTMILGVVLTEGQAEVLKLAQVSQ